MKKIIQLFLFISTFVVTSQDLSQGYIANDLQTRPMQPQSKPTYLGSFLDNSFPNTKITRISDAGSGNYTVPMYSTIQSWNADESLMLIYSNTNGHQLLNGSDYTFIRDLTEVKPADVEQLFWHFNDPEILFYLESGTNDFISYSVSTQEKTTIVNLKTVSGCDTGISMGNDIQMMSWDSDVLSFRCGNTAAFYYRISSGTLTEFEISDIAFTAPMPFPSGDLFYHISGIYGADGKFIRSLNINKVEHSCLGKLSNGDDAYFAIGFEEGPNGGCQGTLVAHNATNGNCFSVTTVQDYGYPQSGTHISALAHKNTEGGWVAVSMMGYDLDGQDLLDQELFVAQVNENDANVYRVAHHRSDEAEFDYWGEPHVTISPTGTRLLFGSDWSGTEDGVSIDSYVAELNSSGTLNTTNFETTSSEVFPNPVNNFISISNGDHLESYTIFSLEGRKIKEADYRDSSIDVSKLSNGLYILQLNKNGKSKSYKFVKEND